MNELKKGNYMTEQSFTTPTYSQQDLYRATLAARLRVGTKWFYWIAALSLVNSLILTFGGHISFIIGLGITQVVDGLFLEMGQSGAFISFGIDLIIAAIFAGFGYFGAKNLSWVIILGLALYALDALIFVLIPNTPDFFSLAFHGYAGYGIWRGLAAGLTLNKIARGTESSTPSTGGQDI